MAAKKDHLMADVMGSSPVGLTEENWAKYLADEKAFPKVIELADTLASARVV